MRNCGFILHCKLFKDLSNPAANCINEHNPLSRSLKRNYNINIKTFWSSWIMYGTCMLFTFGKRVPPMRQGTSVVWRPSLPLMNSFNKTEAAVFSCRLCFLGIFPIISLIQRITLTLQTFMPYHSGQHMCANHYRN